MRADPTELPHLLLVDADEHEPALAAGAPLAAAPAEAAGEEPTHFWRESDLPNELAEQRWAVIAPSGPEGDALLAQVRPLIEARAAQQGAPVREYRVPPGMRADEAAQWKKQVFEASERYREDLPRYQLVLGDLHQVSVELQTILATDGFVGRLAFDRPADYTAYVDKLLAAERTGMSAPARAVFHTVHDGTAATAIGHQALVEPATAMAAELRARRQASFPGEVVVRGDAADPHPDELLAEAGRAGPGVLFSVSHGEGAPRGGWRSAAEQRARQGAMSFGRAGGQLTAEALTGATFMPGGVWFMLACFGAGTPERSKYKRWLDALVAEGQFNGRPEVVLSSLPAPGVPPFVAALPKAALASPRGPLAFVGHVDLAWTYSFRELDSGRAQSRPTRFVQTLAAMLRGDRVGVAFHELFRYFAQTSTELTALDDAELDAPRRRAHLWMLRNDLAGYLLLGDPAARLSIGPAPPAAARERPTPVDLGAPAPTLAAIEAAIGALLGGQALPEAAARHGLTEDALRGLFERYRAAGRQAIGMP